MKGFSELIVVLSFAIAPSVQAAESADQKFVEQAAIANLAEVELANLAREKASRPETKEYAEHMLKDHQQANEKLKSLASQKGIQLPTEPDAKHKREKDRLSKMSGPDFDRAYIESMVKDHKQVLNQFEKQAKGGKDGDLKTFAAEMVPSLRQHLEQARLLDQTVKKTQKQGS